MSLVDNFYLSAKRDYQPKLHGRMDEIKAAAGVLEASLRARFPAYGVVLSLALDRLDAAMASYFYDIHRYKHFHGMLSQDPPGLVNYAKVYAFTVKWLNREKPFSLKRTGASDAVEPEFLWYSGFINELIALSWVHLSYKAIVGEKLITSKVEDKKIFYTLRFRDFSTSLFELFLLTKFPKGPGDDQQVPGVVA